MTIAEELSDHATSDSESIKEERSNEDMAILLDVNENNMATNGDAENTTDNMNNNSDFNQINETDIGINDNNTSDDKLFFMESDITGESALPLVTIVKIVEEENYFTKIDKDNDDGSVEDTEEHTEEYDKLRMRKRTMKNLVALMK
jgi:hypothetical protein